MQIEFKEDGESPEIGIFKRGFVRVLPAGIGMLFIERGLAVEVKEKKKEVKENG